MGFNDVSKANFKAFCVSNRTTEIIAKKQEIVDTLSAFHNLSPTSILFVGFSSFLFAKYNAKEITVTGIDQEMQNYLTEKKVRFKYIPETELINCAKQFQVVVAVDEYFTYADSDQSQKNSVNQICKLATDFVITTLRDYKNQDYKDREFSLPTAVKSSGQNLVFLEAHDWNSNDRNAWSSKIYQIDNSDNSLVTYGSFERRAMYFKQLAKFSGDAGSSHFLVHKNLMYKGLFKKNYEHVITIKFD